MFKAHIPIRFCPNCEQSLLEQLKAWTYKDRLLHWDDEYKHCHFPEVQAEDPDCDLPLDTRSMIAFIKNEFSRQLDEDLLYRYEFI